MFMHRLIVLMEMACMCTSSDIGLVNPFKDRNTDIAEQPIVVVHELAQPRKTKEK
jgi:hypothetical protein